MSCPPVAGATKAGRAVLDRASRRALAVGRPVADNDLWIAATATAVDVALVTLNRRHFEPLALHGLTVL